MRIAQIATLGTPVRPTGSGSIESLVWLLSRELTELGHEVTVFAAAGSSGPFEIVEALPGTYGAGGSPDDWQLCEWINLSRAVEQSGRFDLLHSHAYLWGMPFGAISRAPMVHTIHILPDDDSRRLRLLYPEAAVTGISRYQWRAFPEMPPAAIVHHGIDPRQFTFEPEPRDYLCYLGRFTWGKGAHVALEVARRLGMRLVLAGPSNDYFTRLVEPHVDGVNVEYLGPIGGARRDALLGGARALLYPMQEPEPFGLVMIEAMMCGTPVAAIDIGAVGEIVVEGISGALAADREGLDEAVIRALDLDRTTVRAFAENQYSVQAMAAGYLDIYRRLVTPGD
jgi:glycosyltransferase involved in cell wall biosynthesis